MRRNYSKHGDFCFPFTSLFYLCILRYFQYNFNMFGPLPFCLWNKTFLDAEVTEELLLRISWNFEVALYKLYFVRIFSNCLTIAANKPCCFCDFHNTCISTFVVWKAAKNLPRSIFFLFRANLIQFYCISPNKDNVMMHFAWFLW